MAVNKVVYGGETLVDLTNDTVTPETLAEGVTAHDASGAVITGTMTAGGGDNLLAQLLESATFANDEVTEINEDLFRGWQYVVKISLPNVTKTATTGYLCYGCTKLEEVYMPKCENLGGYAFYNNTSLKVIDFPKLTAVPGNGFRQCTSATKANLPCCTSIAANGFLKDTALTTVILRSNKVCTLANVNAFNDTPIASGTGYVYVPSALVDSYKSASSWSTYASQFRAIEDYPEICGG